MTKVCYVLAYRAPHYVRTEAILQALRNITEIELFVARNSKTGFFRYVETLVRFLKIRFKENPDIYLVGFRGHEIYWLIRLLAKKKKIIFDEMMSPWDAFAGEKNGYSRSNLISKLLYIIEKNILHNADIVLTDTEAHVEFLTTQFKLEKEKTVAIPVGTDEHLYSDGVDRISEKRFRNFLVFFYATFLPLHGVDYVLEAASLLQDINVSFLIVGGRGRTKALREITKKINTYNLPNLYHKEWVEPEQLPNIIANSDLCLGGPFGGTPQARRVVTGKTYQFICMGKPTIIGEIENINPLFKNKVNCLIVEQQNPIALADTICWAYENPTSLKSIGENAKQLYWNEFSSQRLSEILETIIKEQT